MAPGSVRFGYSSPFWTTTETLNADQTLPVMGVDAKLPAYALRSPLLVSSPPVSLELTAPSPICWSRYNSAQMSGIKICVGQVDRCYTYHFGFVIESALTLWGHAMPADNVLGTAGSGYIAAPGLNQQMFEELWDVQDAGYHDQRGATHEDCMQRPGINTACKDRNRVRFGFCGNVMSQSCQGDDADSDFAIGIGGTGQNDPTVFSSGFNAYYHHSLAAPSQYGPQTWV